MQWHKASYGIVLGTLAGPASANLLIYDPFDYSPVGAELSTAGASGGWLKVPASATLEPTIASGSLNYPGLPWTPTGNSVAQTGGATAIQASSTLRLPGQPFFSAEEPTLYYSMLFNVSNVAGTAGSNGSFVAGFRNNTSTGGLAGFEAGAPLLIRQTATGSGLFQLGTGLTQETADRTWDTANEYDAATGTLLLVLSYQFVAGGEDFARLWVNPDPTKTEAENSGAGGTVGNALKVVATATDGHGIREGRITNFFLRNNGSAPDAFSMDELRAATSWEGVFQTAVSGIWLGGAGNWSESAKWSAGIVPNNAALGVQIDKGNAAASAVTFDQDASARTVALNAGDTFTIPAGRTLNLAGAGSEFSGMVDNSGTINAPAITVSGAGGQLVNNGALNISNLRLIDGGTLALGQGSKLLNLNLTLPNQSPLAIDTVDGSKLDLADGKMIVAGGTLGTWNGTAYTGTTGMVDSGRGSAGNALWDGAGVVTTDTRAINNGDLVSIGVAQVSEVRTVTDTETTTFAGQTVLGSDTLVMVTWGGDANLDGKINIDDYGRIDGNVGQSGSVFGWSRGDFNYDGKINIDDYGIIDGNINRQGTPFSTSGSAGSASLEGAAAVPEPASVSLVVLAGLRLMRRRRRAPGRIRVAETNTSSIDSV